LSVAPPRNDDLTAAAAAEAWALIAQLFFEHGRPRMMAIGQEFELSPPQSIVLRLLDEPRPMGELAQSMHCDNSNMTGIVDRLEERGLVERTQAEGDRRVRLIALTERGREIREELNRRMAEPPAPLAELKAEDQAHLRDIMRRAFGP
jgi:MarR family transcriptional regulator, organic hydroperoxide resistance regulator